MGRRGSRDAPGSAVARWPVADLDRSTSHAAILPAVAQRLLGRMPTLGRCHALLSPDQRPATRAGGESVLPDPPSATNRRRPVGGGRFCPPSRSRRIRRLDHRAEEHPVGAVLPGRGIDLSPLRRKTQRVVLWTGDDLVHPGIVEQDGNGDTAGGAAGGLLVAARASVVEARRDAADPVVHARGGRRALHSVGRAKVPWRRGRCVRLDPASALSAGRACRLVLLGQALLAGEADVHLPAVGGERLAVAAIPLSHRCHGAGSGTVADSRTYTRAAGGVPLFRRHAFSGARFLQRLSVCLLLRRGSFPVPGQPRDHRRSMRRPGARAATVSSLGGCDHIDGAGRHAIRVDMA